MLEFTLRQHCLTINLGLVGITAREVQLGPRWLPHTGTINIETISSVPLVTSGRLF